MNASAVDIGIDLGTTFSVLAVDGPVDLAPGYPSGIWLEPCRVTIIPTPYGEPTFASVMAIDPAAPDAPAFAADALQAIDDGLTSVSFSKRKIGTREAIALGEGSTSAKAIATDFLRYLKRCAEQALGRPVRRAVVTHPAYFDRAAVEETREAASAAGFDMGLAEQTLMEPVAAALTYTRADARDPLTVLTYDLGGGTFDATCLERRSGVISMRSFDGDPLLGGYNFDRRIVQWLLERLKLRGRRIELSDADAAGRARLARLLRLAERTKIQLAGAPVDDYPVLCRGRGMLVDVNGRDVPIDERITRTQFVEMIGDELERSVDRTRGALERAGLQADDIDEILLVGGSSRGPWVAAAIGRAFPGVSCRLFQPDLCVGAGAAIYASMVLPAVPRGEVYELRVEAPASSPLERIRCSGQVRRIDGGVNEAGLTLRLAATGGGMQRQQQPGAAGDFAFDDVDLLDDDNRFELTLLDAAGQVQARHELAVRYQPEGGEALSVVSVQPRTLAIETLDGLVSLAEAGTALPARCERRFLRQNDNPSIELRLFQDHAVVGEIRIRDLPPELGRGALVHLLVEVSAAGQVHGLATVSPGDGRSGVSTPVQVRIAAPEIAPTAALQQRHRELRDQWSVLAAQDAERAGEIEAVVQRTLRQLDRLWAQLPLERQELHAGLSALDRLLNPPPDDMVPTRAEFRRKLGRCKDAVDALGAGVPATDRGGGPADGTQRRRRERVNRMTQELARLEADGLEAHRRRDRRAWARISEAVDSLALQARPARRSAGDDTMPTASVKVLAAREVAREVERLNRRAAELRAQERLDTWQVEIARVFRALNDALAEVQAVDDGLPAEQGRARIGRWMASVLEPIRRDIAGLGAQVARVDEDALAAGRVALPSRAGAAEDASPMPALLTAMQWGQEALFEALLAPGVDLETRNERGHRPLMLAAHGGQTEFVRELLVRGAAVDAADAAGWTALMHAAQEGQVAAATLLLERGAAVDAATPEGFTALMIAAHFGRVPMLELLLARGADREARSHGARTPLMHAAVPGQADAVRALLAGGADPIACDERGSTAMFDAAENGRLDVIEALLQAGVDPNQLRDADHGNVLMLAAWHGLAAAIERLGPLIRDLEQRDKDGDTALANAAIQGRVEVLERLIALGCAVDTANDAGITPLMHAAARGHVDAVRLLLAQGAAAGARDPDGRNAWAMALAGGHDAVAALLEAGTASAGTSFGAGGA
ncbi:MAG: ankyrin repeat domain-containing protein [Immundisolibacter sp.]|uniref:ankyrin repeat domain-containing protein n=1 Tax=Immundisolibacter sp. TaxID=1934948 RepID=UPI003D0E73C4